MITTGLADRYAEGLSAHVAGGFLAQNRDAGAVSAEHLKTVTSRAPDASEMADLLFAWQVAKHVKSNAIVYAKDGADRRHWRRSDEPAGQFTHRGAQIRGCGGGGGLSAPLVLGSVVASDAFFRSPMVC